jgi:hypothetical protein
MDLSAARELGPACAHIADYRSGAELKRLGTEDGVDVRTEILRRQAGVPVSVARASAFSPECCGSAETLAALNRISSAIRCRRGDMRAIC